MTDPQNFSAMGDLLKKVMENPELLSGAMSMASALASSGALNGLLGRRPGEERKDPDPDPPRPEQSGSAVGGQPGMPDPAMLSGLSSLMSALGGGNPSAKSPQDPPNPSTPPKPPSAPQSEHRRVGHRERIALLEAMRPFISPEKKDRLELLIRLLGVMEIAEGMGLGI